MGADIASCVGGNTTTVNDDTVDDEADDCDDFYQAENEFDYGVY